MYLVDTNILCEPTKVAPNAKIILWFEENEPMIRISAISIGEINYGIEILAAGKKKSELRKWLELLQTKFAESILPIDHSVALRWGYLKSHLEQRGRKMPAIDSFLAATALEHGLTIVTGNSKDFLNCGVKLLDPA